MKVYDLLILGAGPAGITAAVYCARKNLDFAIITTDIGGQTAWSGDIENYNGYQFVTGPELTLKFQEHMERFGIEINMPEKVKGISKENNILKTSTDKKDYFSKVLIVSTGKNPKFLDVEGEIEFKGKGVTYCATCDGPLFKDKNVAIIGGGNSALDAALQMVKISPKVHIIDIAPSLSADPVMIEKLKDFSGATIWSESKVKRIKGDNFVKAIDVEKKGKIHSLDVEGVFVEIGLIPNSNFADVLERNEKGEIVVDFYNRTSTEGVFAAGDVTNVPEKQIIIACGEGSKASLAAFRYLYTHK